MDYLRSVFHKHFSASAAADSEPVKSVKVSRDFQFYHIDRNQRMTNLSLIDLTVNYTKACHHTPLSPFGSVLTVCVCGLIAEKYVGGRVF